LLIFAARVCPCYHIIRLLGHTGRHASASSHNEGLGLLAGHAGEGPREDEYFVV
jgi:hypothetical protein